MLDYDRHVPAGAADGALVIVLLHGRGSDKGDLMGLQPFLPSEAIVVAPQAPFPAAPWGYGPGWAWYRHLGGSRPEPETFEEGQTRLHDFLTRLPGELAVRPGRLVLGGFSQGGTMSLAYTLRHPGAVQGVINLSGYLADHPSVRVTPETVRGVPVFWGHGTEDPVIPIEMAIKGRRILREAGAALTTRDYALGHGVNEVELRDLRDWLEES